MRNICVGLMVVGLLAPALAAEAPPIVPTTAKKPTGAEINKLYVGYVRWNNIAAKGNGVALYDLKNKKQHVIWDIGGNQGAFTGPIRVKDDTFCYKVPQQKESCVSVYLDGEVIYEVDKKGAVASRNTKLSTDAAKVPAALPATAKKLTGAELSEAYNGLVRWWNPGGGNGVAFHDVKVKKQQHAIFDVQGNQGTFSGPMRVKQDNICFKVGQPKETCMSAYRDGDAVYVVDAKGVIGGMDTPIK